MAMQSVTRRSLSALHRCRTAPFSQSLFARSAARSLSTSAIRDIGPQEALELQKEGKRYLDVRTVEEFAAGHAPGAINIPILTAGPFGMAPNPEFLNKVSETFKDASETIVVGCKAGGRSMSAAQVMSSQAGFKDLLNVRGGFDSWMAQGLPIEK